MSAELANTLPITEFTEEYFLQVKEAFTPYPGTMLAEEWIDFAKGPDWSSRQLFTAPRHGKSEAMRQFACTGRWSSEGPPQTIKHSKVKLTYDSSHELLTPEMVWSAKKIR